jgi:hypothetical protein
MAQKNNPPPDAGDTPRPWYRLYIELFSKLICSFISIQNFGAFAA